MKTIIIIESDWIYAHCSIADAEEVRPGGAELPEAGLAEALPGMPVCAVSSVGPDGVSRSVERLAALAAGVMRKGSICVTAPEQP